jgi:hypothetical protein
LFDWNFHIIFLRVGGEYHGHSGEERRTTKVETLPKESKINELYVDNLSMM